MSIRSKGSVRMGPISLFALIVLLSLAALAVLTVSTAQANFASSEKQARFTTDTYANETAGQRLLAHVDNELADLRDQGVAREVALVTLENSLPNGTWLDGEIIRAEFYQESGRTLVVTIGINSNLEYEIIQWQTRTPWINDEENETLWSGATN